MTLPSDPARTRCYALDPRGERTFCFTISDKALAVAGGVLEAVVSWLWRTAGIVGEGS